MSEYRFFANNSALGQFYFWHMVGTKSHPAASVFDGATRTWLAGTYGEWGTDRLVQRVPALRQMLITPAALPQIIYFHCEKAVFCCCFL